MQHKSASNTRTIDSHEPRSRTRVRTIAAVVAVAGLMAGGALTALPAQAATCTTSPTTWADLQTAFSTAPATGAVICLGADISHTGTTNGGPVDSIDVPAGAAVTFDLNGHSLTAFNPGSGDGTAVLDVSAGESLTVDATGGGALTLTTSSGGAAIGSPANVDSGTIVINSGTLNLLSGYDGAALGGGQYGSSGPITINGGTVTATTSNCGAGIGAGEYSVNVGAITINGGVVTTTGSCGSPGLGGASGVAGGIVVITGGTVVATGTQGAGIGGGFTAAGGTVTISGGDVTARSLLGGAAIGSGTVYSGQTIPAPGTLTLIGAGTPTNGSGSNIFASSPTATVQAGPEGVSFTQTTQNADETNPIASTRIVFTITPVIPPTTTPATTSPVANQTVPLTPAVGSTKLASTGFDAMIIVGFGGLAAAAGVLLLAATRRRRA